MTARKPRGGPSESQFQLAVEQLAQHLGIRCWHDQDSRRNDAGLPDLILVGTTVLWRELKTDTGRVSKDQQDFHADLEAAGQDIAVWRPADMRSGRILSELRGVSPRIAMRRAS